MSTMPYILGFSFSAQSILLIALPVLGSVMLAYGVAQATFDLRRSQRKRVMNRLRGGAGKGRPEDMGVFNPEDLRRQAVDAKGVLAGLYSKLKFTQNLQTVLDQAYVPWSAPKLLVNLTAISTVTAAVLMLFKAPVAVTLFAPAALFMMPILYLFRRRKKRLTRLVEQLPDVFELLGQALRAGHSLASGMQLISRQMSDPAATEFGRVFYEQNLGLKIEDAMKNLAERTDVLDVRFFVTAVLIQRQTGGDLAEILDKIGSVIRGRIKLFGTVQALTAEGRLSGYVLLALPPLVLGVMMFINRDYAMTLFNEPAGRMMLSVAGTMQLMGWALIKKIVNIKV